MTAAPSHPFTGQVSGIRKSSLYVLGLLITAAMMVLLPLVYLAIIGAAVYGIYWHSASNTWILLKGGGKAGLLGYSLPILAGVILVFFLIKPLFARRMEREDSLTLRRADQPRLFEYVEQLCALLRSPAPREIRVDCSVNASAGFRRGMLSFLGRDLVLTVGLPLIAGMSLRQWSGVLAHELGHFCQFSGMRLSYLIRGINAWFASAVYERDVWDEWLTRLRQSGFGVAILLAWLSRLMVWLTRRVLWVLMMLGHAVSSFMSRQMEYDADRYETVVAGTEASIQASELLRRYSLASIAANLRLRADWTAGRLADNLPAFIVANAERVPEALRKDVEANAAEHEGRWYASHPSDQRRQEQVRQEAQPGVVACDAPASTLIDHFDELCRTTSMLHYRHQIGDEVTLSNMVPTERLMREHADNQEQSRTVEEYLGFDLHGNRPILLRPVDFDGQAPSRTLLEAVRDGKRRMKELSGDILAAFNESKELEEKLHDVSAAAIVVRADIGYTPKGLGIPAKTADQVEAGRTVLLDERTALDRRFREFENALSIRTMGLIYLQNHASMHRHFADAAERFAESMKLVKVLRIIADAFPEWIDVREHVVALRVAFRILEDHEDNANVQMIIHHRLGLLSDLLRRSRTELRDTPYPFEHAGGEVSLSEYLVGQSPGAHSGVGVLEVAVRYINHTLLLHRRVFVRLMFLASEVENALRAQAQSRRQAGTPQVGTGSVSESLP